MMKKKKSLKIPKKSGKIEHKKEQNGGKIY